ncbi:PadR family transcriptional regulator [Parvimonas micra]
MDTQIKKGLLDLCVLSFLIDKDMYGYEIVQSISKSIEVSEGTIYPILRRLSKEGYFETYIVESNEGPARKYYRITALGIEFYKKQLNSWEKLKNGMDSILKRGENNDN